MNTSPVNGFKEHRSRFKQKLSEDSVTLIYSGQSIPQSLDSYYSYYLDNNYYYLTGLTEEGGLLVLTNVSGTVNEILFIPRPDYEKEKWTGILMTAEKASMLSGIDAVYYIDEIEDILVPLLEEVQFLGLDALQKEHQRGKIIPKPLEDRFNRLQTEDVSYKLEQLRLIKNPWELERMKKAVDITRKGLNAVLLELHSGMKEYEISALFEYIVKKNGAELAFPTIAASGKNGPILHYETNRETLKSGSLLLLDLGARWEGYAADVSRTYPVSGKFKTNQRKLYECVLRVEEEMIEEYRVGVLLKDLQELTIEKFSQYLPAYGFTLPAGGIGQWYYHSIGHSLGLDTHDGRSRNLTLMPGMVITCEPGIYIADIDTGIRIEDDILITEDGPVNLTKKIVKDPDKIMDLMR